jgi:hypothetical protein
MFDRQIRVLLPILVLALASISAGSPGVLAQNLPLRANMLPSCAPDSGFYYWKFADIYADGNIAVQGTYNCRGVFIWDVSDPDNPVLASHYNPTPAQAFLEVTVKGNRGYFGSGGLYPTGMADSGDGVHIVDLTNPYNPVLLGKINTSNGGYNGIHEMIVAGNYLFENYNSTSNKVLKIFDISNPANPVFKWNVIPTDSLWVHAVHARGNRLYTSGWRGMIDIYDISDLATKPPVFLGAIAGDNNNHTSYTSEDGNYLYSARETTNGDIRVYDVRDPSQPLLMKTISTSQLGLDAISPHDPMVMGDKLYVSWYQAGLQIFDISDPVSPVRVGQYDTFNGTYLAPPQSSLSNADPWDVICGVNYNSNSLQGVPNASFDGAWAVNPLLGINKVLVGDMTSGIYIVDASSLSSPSLSLSGRVLTPDGNGLRNAVVTLRGSNGMVRSTLSSSLGYYSFEDLAGGSYTLDASSRRYRFDSRSVDLSSSLATFDFIGLE